MIISLKYFKLNYLHLLLFNPRHPSKNFITPNIKGKKDQTDDRKRQHKRPNTKYGQTQTRQVSAPAMRTLNMKGSKENTDDMKRQDKVSLLKSMFARTNVIRYVNDYNNN